MALLSCKEVLMREFHQATNPDNRAAYRILAEACEAPIFTLLQNAGENPYDLLPQIRNAGPGYGYDVVEGKITKMTEAGIFDSAAVVREAAIRAILGAALALTVDVLVHSSNPPKSYHKT